MRLVEQAAGRVAVVLSGSGSDFSIFTGRMTTLGARGNSNGQMSGAGTVYRQTTAQGANGGQLVIDNNIGNSAAYRPATALDDSTARSVTVGSLVVCGDAVFEVGSDDTLTTTAVQATGTAPTSGLMAAFPMSEGAGTSTADASGNGNAVTLLGNTAWGNGRSGSGLVFDGDYASYCTFPTTAALRTPNFTYCVWVKANKPHAFMAGEYTCKGRTKIRPLGGAKSGQWGGVAAAA